MYLILYFETMERFHAEKTVANDNCDQHQMGENSGEYLP